MPGCLYERLYIAYPSPPLSRETDDHRLFEVVVCRPGVSDAQLPLITFREAALANVVGDDRMHLIESVSASLHKVLGEQHPKSGEHWRFEVLDVEVGKREAGLERHRLAIDRESEQQCALEIIELPHIDVVEEVACNISVPQWCIERVFKEQSKREAAIATEEGS